MTASVDLRQVATQFLALTGLTIAELARRGEVHRPNCLAWLAGKEQVFSEKKQLKVCELLGWRFGRLRRDMVHRWEIGSDFFVLKEVLAAYEICDPEITLTIFQAKGQDTERAAIIIGVSRGMSPLVILAKRPLGYGMPASITAAMLGYGCDGKHEHSITEAEWKSCWDTTAVSCSAEEYLDTYAHLLWEETRLQDINHMGMVTSQHLPDEIQAYETDLSLEEVMEWDAVLYQAKHSGMNFQEILARVREALNLDEQPYLRA